MSFDIQDVVETLKNAKARGKKCSVLIGAGCSVTAGIPTAQGFVDRIKKDYPRAYKRPKKKTYPKCMSKLAPDEQRDLIAGYVDHAKINWAHIALAQLIKADFVDRVLTTNFDSLIVRACALTGIFPAVYDFAASQCFEYEKVPDQAIFYLHGQRTGFVLINTPKKYKEHSKKLDPIFDDAGRGRVWLVVGYSGENDPVFEHLANIPHFDNNLYWIGHNNTEPAPHIREKLLVDGKYAHYINGFDADNFFVTLAKMLGCFPPDLVGKPFSYLNNLFEMVTPYTFPQSVASPDVLQIARKFVREAIENVESVQTDALDGWSGLLGGNYNEVINLKVKYPQGFHPEIADAITWAYVMQGVELSEKATRGVGEEVDRLFTRAYEKYAEALKVKPDKYEAFYNWGFALTAQARTKAGEEADRLFTLVYEKYAAALKVKPDMHEALNTWGLALQAQARVKSGTEADSLFARAGEKYTEALKVKPNYHEALNNWGLALQAQARMKSGAEAESLFARAGEKYTEALKVKPDYHEVLNNWGLALQSQAKMKSGEEADRLFGEARAKYAKALKIKPDLHEALNNWGGALYEQAKMKTGVEADALFMQARAKCAEALKIKPDYHEALNNWGFALTAQARTKAGEEADQLFGEAGVKYSEALKIKPDYHEALNNWGTALQAQAEKKSDREADALFAYAGEKYAEALKVKPDDAATLNNWGVTLLYQWRYVADERKEELIVKAKKVLGKAETNQPGIAAYNLACACSLSGQEEECHRWLVTSKSAGRLPEHSHLEKDSDLDPVRNTKWFKEFIKTLE